MNWLIYWLVKCRAAAILLFMILPACVVRILEAAGKGCSFLAEAVLYIFGNMVHMIEAPNTNQVRKSQTVASWMRVVKRLQISLGKYSGEQHVIWEIEEYCLKHKTENCLKWLRAINSARYRVACKDLLTSGDDVEPFDEVPTTTELAGTDDVPTVLLEKPK